MHGFFWSPFSAEFPNIFFTIRCGRINLYICGYINTLFLNLLIFTLYHAGYV